LSLLFHTLQSHCNRFAFTLRLFFYFALSFRLFTLHPYYLYVHLNTSNTLHQPRHHVTGMTIYSTVFISFALLGVNNIALLGACIFCATVGLIMMDVMADTMCVERAKLEPEHFAGQMQASFYSARFAGSVIGAVVGALVCNKQQWDGWGLTFFQVSHPLFAQRPHTLFSQRPHTFAVLFQRFCSAVAVLLQCNCSAFAVRPVVPF
jgi:MFS family permease